jgi:hypothetical protein
VSENLVRGRQETALEGLPHDATLGSCGQLMHLLGAVGWCVTGFSERQHLDVQFRVTHSDDWFVGTPKVPLGGEHPRTFIGFFLDDIGVVRLGDDLQPITSAPSQNILDLLCPETDSMLLAVAVRPY